MAGALLTTREAAAEMGVCAETIRRLIRAGQLPAARVGGQWRVDRGHLPQPRVHRPPSVDVRAASKPWPREPGRSLAVAMAAKGRA